MESTRRQISEILKAAKRPALWLSFGKDSRLLQRLAQDAGFNGVIYYFNDVLSELAGNIIINEGLTVFSWPATSRYLVPNGDGLAQVDEYAVGNTLVPLVSPVEKGEQCNHGDFQPARRAFGYPHDITLTGMKRGETCDAVGIVFPQTIDIGVTTLVSPLYEWTDAEVVAACEELGITYEESNVAQYCDRCLEAINNSTWDREAALSNFRTRFLFH